MSGNVATIPPLVPLSPPTTVQIIPDNNSPYAWTRPVSLILKPTLPIVQRNKGQLILENPIAPVKDSALLVDNNRQIPENSTGNIVYKITYPEELNLRYIKQGRPKGKAQQKLTDPVKEDKPPPIKAQRTRSGRVVKTPKHIEKDFEKILITQHDAEFKTEKFVSTEKDKDENNKTLQELETHSKKRTISSRFRCSSCNKSYLSKKIMYQHLLKNPDHGPLPDRNNNNFDVWNYLVDVTQKCPSGQRGTKFCEELTNLLHNVQLLTNALFKTSISSSNQVHVDKVLGNVIGLQPGKYHFDENELYKDITVLKLIKNSQFFAPKKSPSVDASEKNIDGSCSNEMRLKSLEKQEEPVDKKMRTEEEVAPVQDPVKKSSNSGFDSDSKMIREEEQNVDKSDTSNMRYNEMSSIKFDKSVNSDEKSVQFPDNLLQTNFTNIHGQDSSSNEKSAKPVQSDVILKSPSSHCVDTFNKGSNSHLIDNNFKKLDSSLNLSSDLLSDNSLLTLPNLRTSDDEIMLSSVSTSGHLLDNSTSSDEMMNVDQFVNERFKKITEPDPDLKFNASLNIDLPPLDLFQFHTS